MALVVVGESEGQYIARSTITSTLFVEVIVVATDVASRPGIVSSETVNRLLPATVSVRETEPLSGVSNRASILAGVADGLAMST